MKDSIIRSLLQRWLIPGFCPYEVLGLAGESYEERTRDPYVVWLGPGTWGIAEGFYRTEQQAREAAKKVPEGYSPCIYFLAPDAYVKQEISL